jgi:hypothetical protein
MIARRNMHFLATASKHVNSIRAIARQPPIKIEGLLEAVFSVGFTARLYIERTPGRLTAVHMKDSL